MEANFRAAMAREQRFVTGASTVYGTKNPTFIDVERIPWRGGNAWWDSIILSS
jgi:hypothetical protein